MATWKEYIERLRKEWIGKKVNYEGRIYTIAAVDYNGFLHIDKPSQYNPTTAVFEEHEAKRALVTE